MTINDLNISTTQKLMSSNRYSKNNNNKINQSPLDIGKIPTHYSGNWEIKQSEI